MNIHGTIKTADTLSIITPEMALELLKEGNKRFVTQQMIKRDHKEHVRNTIDGQHPFAVILSCIDSRVVPEFIFDQGIGDLFITRIAGNIINRNILGSMEYACAVTGSKLVVVLGHTSCGAVKGAIDNVQFGNLTGALRPIRKAIKEVSVSQFKMRTSKNTAFVNAVATVNVELAINDIKRQSPVLSKMYEKEKIDIVGAMYNHTTGVVEFSSQ